MTAASILKWARIPRPKAPKASTCQINDNPGLPARMMPSPLVSICIPTYNRPDYLRRAVESCLRQTYPHFEIVITDNSTNQESADLAAKWTDPRIHYYSNGGNIGPHASSIRSVSLGKGEYLKFLMDDDLLKPRCLELMV